MKLRYLSVCSGIEAATCAWHPLGMEPVAFSEIEAFPSAVLAHHYPSVPNWGDMTRFQEWPNAALDVLVGGTPCQAFSVAGLRKGLADPRGNLTLVFLAIAARYRPRWVVWENVPGVLSSLSHDAPDPSAPPPPVDMELDGQEVESHDEYGAEELHAFNSFLAGLSELGYGWAYRVLDAQFFGVAQRRRRVFVVGHLGDWRRAAAVLFERDSMSGNPAPCREAREGIAPSLAARTRGGGGLGTDAECDGAVIAIQERACADTNCGPGGKGYREDGSAYTLEARHHVQAIAHLPQVCGTLSDGAHMGGGSTDRTLTPDELSRCLNAGAMGRCDWETETFVPVRTGGGFDGSRMLAFSCKDSGADAGEIAPTLRSMGHDGSHANAGGQVAVAFGAQNSARQGASASASVTPTLDKSKVPGVATSMRVRRLTPTECERLQGFADGYTLVPYNGKPAKDGPRYKALGNSMAVPVMRWIGERIVAVEAINNQEQAA